MSATPLPFLIETRLTQTEPGPFGFVRIVLGGKELGRSEEPTFLLPVLTMLEEALTLSREASPTEEPVSSTEFLDGIDLRVCRRGSNVIWRWNDLANHDKESVIDIEAAAVAIRDFRALLTKNTVE